MTQPPRKPGYDCCDEDASASRSADCAAIRTEFIPCRIQDCEIDWEFVFLARPLETSLRRHSI
jgi:hypothetical protein